MKVRAIGTCRMINGHVDLGVQFSPQFDAASVDHNVLAQHIGNAVMRVVNHARNCRFDAQRLTVEVTFTVASDKLDSECYGLAVSR